MRHHRSWSLAPVTLAVCAVTCLLSLLVVSLRTDAPSDGLVTHSARKSAFESHSLRRAAPELVGSLDSTFSTGPWTVIGEDSFEEDSGMAEEEEPRPDETDAQVAEANYVTGGVEAQPRLFSSKLKDKPRHYATVLPGPVKGQDWTQAYLDVPPADNTHPFLESSGLAVIGDRLQNENVNIAGNTASPNRDAGPSTSVGSSTSDPGAVEPVAVSSVSAVSNSVPLSPDGSLSLIRSGSEADPTGLTTEATTTRRLLQTGMAEREERIKPGLDVKRRMAASVSRADSDAEAEPTRIELEPVAVTPKPTKTREAPRRELNKKKSTQQQAVIPKPDSPETVASTVQTIPHPQSQSQPVSIEKKGPRDVLVHIDSQSNGFAGEQVARINDAIATINKVTSATGLDVRLSAVSAPTSQADVRLQVARDRSLGRKVLGYADAFDDRLGGTVSISSGFDWYTGADPSQIAAGQYDFQTAVTHELLHLLGLEDRYDTIDLDPQSQPVMHFGLDTGLARRAPTAADAQLLAQAFRNGRPVSKSGALTAVPEPATLGMLLLGATLFRRRH